MAAQALETRGSRFRARALPPRPSTPERRARIRVCTGNDRIGKWLDDQNRKRASAARDAASEAKRLAAEAKRLHDQEIQEAVQAYERQLDAEEQFQRESAQAWDIYTKNVLEIRRQAIQDEAEWFGISSLDRFREVGTGGSGWGEGTFGALAGEMKEQAEKVGDAARSLGLTFQSAFEDAVIAGEDYRDVLRGIDKDLIRLASRRWVTEPLVNAGSEIFSAAGEWLKGLLPGFASGGSFTVGGSGGTDSKLVAFMATPGEHVSVDAGGGNGGGTTIVQNFTINVPAGAGADPSAAREMARVLAGEVKQILVQEMRPGGLLKR